MSVGTVLARSMCAFIIFRFLTGCFGAVPMTVGGGTITDFARPEERGKYVSLISIAPIVGPVVGAVIGGFFSEAKGWRWCLWLMVIMVQLFCILCAQIAVSDAFIVRGSHLDLLSLLRRDLRSHYISTQG